MRRLPLHRAFLCSVWNSCGEWATFSRGLHLATIPWAKEAPGLHLAITPRHMETLLVLNFCGASRDFPCLVGVYWLNCEPLGDFFRRACCFLNRNDFRRTGFLNNKGVFFDQLCCLRPGAPCFADGAAPSSNIGTE